MTELTFAEQKEIKKFLIQKNPEPCYEILVEKLIQDKKLVRDIKEYKVLQFSGRKPSCRTAEDFLDVLRERRVDKKTFSAAVQDNKDVFDCIETDKTEKFPPPVALKCHLHCLLGLEHFKIDGSGLKDIALKLGIDRKCFEHQIECRPPTYTVCNIEALYSLLETDNPDLTLQDLIKACEQLPLNDLKEKLEELVCKRNSMKDNNNRYNGNNKKDNDNSNNSINGEKFSFVMRKTPDYGMKIMD